MTDYSIDWDVTSMNGSADISSSSGGPDLGVTIQSQTLDDDEDIGHASGQLASSYVSLPGSTVISFGSPVTNAAFSVFGFVSGARAGGWSETLSIRAYDADGNEVDVLAEQSDGAGQVMSFSVGQPISRIEIAQVEDDASEAGSLGLSDITFDLAAPVLDGIVSGSNADDTVDIAYTGDPEGDRIDAGDAILPGEIGDDDIVDALGGDDTIASGAGDDEVYAGKGDDFVDGGDGDDLIYGDSDLAGGPGPRVAIRESFNWDKAPDPNDTDPVDNGDALTSFTQDTGQVDVTFSFAPPPAVPQNVSFADNTQNVDGIVGDGAPVNANSSLAGALNSDGQTAEYIWEFSESVENISFRINDIDLDSVVVVRAFDADGNPVPLTVSAGDGVILSDADAVAGDETLVSDGGDALDTSPDHSALVSIAGPVARLEIHHEQDGGINSEINVSDIYFDTFVDDGTATMAADDKLYGGDGSDIIFGEAGDDLISGGAGDGDADQLFGGDDADKFVDLGAGDFVDGGSGGNDDDRLDLRGSAPTGGGLSVTITGPDSDGNGFDGYVTYTDAQGNFSGTLSFENIEDIVPCFTPGTLIATPSGEVPVENLSVGDKVITRDNGIQVVRWAGNKRLSGQNLMAAAHLRPILIRAGALGHGLPERDMAVSPNHRMLVANDRTALFFEEREVLVAAKHLVDSHGIQRLESIGANYHHFMFDRHEVVLANGAWTESFQPGDQTLSGMGNSQRNEIYEIFPELKNALGRKSFKAARKVLKKHEATILTFEKP